MASIDVNRLKEEYQHFSVAPSRWFASLSDDQKKHVQKKFQQASVDDRQDPSSIEEVPSVADKEKFSSMYDREQHSPVDDQRAFDDHLQDGDFSLSQPTDNTLQGACQQGYVLPVDIHNASQITGLPTLVLRQMWSKAADLLSTSDHVMRAPGCSKMSRMVASLSQAKPHFVTSTNDGRFECDESCPAFLQRYICCHTVVAAESNGQLHSFLKSYSKYVKTPKGNGSVTPNYTQLSMVNLPRRTAGRKGGKAPKKKPITRRKVTPSEHRQPLSIEDPGLPAATSATPLAASNSDTSPSCSQATTESPSSSLTIITTSSGNWNWNWDGVSSHDYHYTPPRYTPYYPPPFPPSHSSLLYPPLPYYSPLSDISNCHPYAH